MQGIEFKCAITATLDHAIERATKALAAEGFAILTRIDLAKEADARIERALASA